MREYYNDLFLKVLPLLWAVIIGATHLYLKNKLKERHDNGLLFMAGAFLVWFVMGNVESYYENIRDTPNGEGYWIWRRILSLLNSGFIIYSLSYFKDGWNWLEKQYQRKNFRNLAFGAIIIGALTYSGKDLNKWLIVEAGISITVVFILFFSLASI